MPVIDIEPLTSETPTGRMSVMGPEGDVKCIWDRNKPAEVEAARRQFDRLKGKGFIAYRVKKKSGEKGAAMGEFDPEAEAVILAEFDADAEEIVATPPLRGG